MASVKVVYKTVFNRRNQVDSNGKANVLIESKSGQPREQIAANTQTIRFITDGGLDPYLNQTNLVPTRREQRADVPLSFQPRQFAPREVTIYTMSDHAPV